MSDASRGARRGRMLSIDESAMRSIEEILWPGGDPDAEWSSDEIEDIAHVVREWRQARYLKYGEV